MSNISWDASSLSNYFSASLGKSQDNTGFNNLYNCLNDYSLIKSGKYSTMMKAYYNKKKVESSEDTSKTDTDKKTDTTKKTNTDKTTTSGKTDNTSKTTNSAKNNGTTSKTSDSTYKKDTGSIIDTFI